MHWKFNSDHFTSLKLDNLSSGSKVRWQFGTVMQQQSPFASISASASYVFSPTASTSASASASASAP